MRQQSLAEIATAKCTNFSWIATEEHYDSQLTQPAQNTVHGP